MKQTLYWLDQLMHGGGKAELGIQHWALQDSLRKLLGWGTESPAHNLPALQEGGKRCGFQAHCSWSCKSRVKSWVSSILPSPAACQKHSDPKGFSFHGKCWNLGFIPIWKATRFCKIEILRKIKWLFTAQLYRLMQTASYQKQPPKWVLQSEFPGLSLSRAQLDANPMLTVLQKGSETKQIRHSISKRHTDCTSPSRCALSDATMAEAYVTPSIDTSIGSCCFSALKFSCCSQQYCTYFSLHMLRLSSEQLTALHFLYENFATCCLVLSARRLGRCWQVCFQFACSFWSPYFPQ